MTNNATIYVSQNVVRDGLNYHGILATPNCTGPNPACRKAAREGRTWHVIAPHPKNLGEDSHIVMPTYHYATMQEGIDAVNDAIANAKVVESDEEWLRLEAEHKVAFRTRPNMNHPTRR